MKTDLKRKLLELQKKPDILKIYDDTFKQQKQLGIIEECVEPGEDGEVHYLPHHQVVRNDKQTTKVRVVFDASSKTKNGVSSNDCLYKGPQITPLLFDMLLRYRINPIALSADIEKAFLQISVDPDHRNYLRFLWFDDVFSTQPKIIKNRFARVVFGVNNSPFMLNGAIKKHNEKYERIDFDYYENVNDSFYVDDFAGSDTTTEQTFELYKKLKLRLLENHFVIRKWRTNDKLLREKINLSEPNESIVSSKEKLLGITWMTQTMNLFTT